MSRFRFDWNACMKPWIIRKLTAFTPKDCVKDITQGVVVQVISTKASTGDSDEEIGGTALVHDNQLRLTCSFTKDAIHKFEDAEAATSGADFDEMINALIILQSYRIVPVLSSELNKSSFTLVVSSYALKKFMPRSECYKDTRLAQMHHGVKNKLEFYWRKWKSSNVPIDEMESSLSSFVGSQFSQFMEELEKIEQKEQVALWEKKNPPLDIKTLDSIVGFKSLDNCAVWEIPTLIAESCHFKLDGILKKVQEMLSRDLPESVTQTDDIIPEVPVVEYAVFPEEFETLDEDASYLNVSEIPVECVEILESIKEWQQDYIQSVESATSCTVSSHDPSAANEGDRLKWESSSSSASVGQDVSIPDKIVGGTKQGETEIQDQSTDVTNDGSASFKTDTDKDLNSKLLERNNANNKELTPTGDNSNRTEDKGQSVSTSVTPDEDCIDVMEDADSVRQMHPGKTDQGGPNTSEDMYHMKQKSTSNMELSQTVLSGTSQEHLSYSKLNQAVIEPPQLSSSSLVAEKPDEGSTPVHHVTSDPDSHKHSIFTQIVKRTSNTQHSVKSTQPFSISVMSGSLSRESDESSVNILDKCLVSVLPLTQPDEEKNDISGGSKELFESDSEESEKELPNWLIQETICSSRKSHELENNDTSEVTVKNKLMLKPTFCTFTNCENPSGNVGSLSQAFKCETGNSALTNKEKLEIKKCNSKSVESNCLQNPNESKECHESEKSRSALAYSGVSHECSKQQHSNMICHTSSKDEEIQDIPNSDWHSCQSSASESLISCNSQLTQVEPGNAARLLHEKLGFLKCECPSSQDSCHVLSMLQNTQEIYKTCSETNSIELREASCHSNQNSEERLRTPAASSGTHNESNSGGNIYVENASFVKDADRQKDVLFSTEASPEKQKISSSQSNLTTKNEIASFLSVACSKRLNESSDVYRPKRLKTSHGGTPRIKSPVRIIKNYNVELGSTMKGESTKTNINGSRIEKTSNQPSWNATRTTSKKAKSSRVERAEERILWELPFLLNFKSGTLKKRTKLS